MPYMVAATDSPARFGADATAFEQAAERSAWLRDAGFEEAGWRPSSRGAPDVCGCGERQHHEFEWPRREWLDHPYRLRRREPKQDVWVSEPYRSYEDLMTDPDLDRLEQAGWVVDIRPKQALHLPGSTIAVWISRRLSEDGEPILTPSRSRRDRVNEHSSFLERARSFVAARRKEPPLMNQHAYVKIYRTDNTGELAVETNATSEAELMAQAPSAILRMLKDQATGADEVALEHFLPALVDLVCKLRGYKADTVKEQRVLLAGNFWPTESALLVSTEDERPALELVEARA